MSRPRFFFDEDFNGTAIKQLARRQPAIDFVVLTDLMPKGTQDPEVLERVAPTGRIVVSHDESTMGDAAWERVGRGLVMPGLILIPQRVGIGEAVRKLETVWLNRQAEEFDGLVSRV